MVHTGLRRVVLRRRKDSQKQRVSLSKEGEKALERQEMEERLRKGLWRDGRIDCVAGNGVICELGGGVERVDEVVDWVPPHDKFTAFEANVDESEKQESRVPPNTQNNAAPANGTLKAQLDVEAVRALPIVVIKNFATKRGRDDVLSVLARWAAGIVESQVCTPLRIHCNFY